MGRRSKKMKAPKVAQYVLVSRETDEGREVYDLIKQLVSKEHDQLRDAKISAAWMQKVKSDRDGRLVLGKMKKASELERKMHGSDLIVLLNRTAWKTLNEKQRTALVDHELCHADLSIDTNGEPIEDAEGKKCFRLRKHDIEEFASVVRRHGIYKADLSTFVDAALEGKKKQGDLFEKPKNVTTMPTRATRPTSAATH